MIRIDIHHSEKIIITYNIICTYHNNKLFCRDLQMIEQVRKRKHITTKDDVEEFGYK